MISFHKFLIENDVVGWGAGTKGFWFSNLRKRWVPVTVARVDAVRNKLEINIDGVERMVSPSSLRKEKPK